MLRDIIEIINTGGVINWILFALSVVLFELGLRRWIALKTIKKQLQLTSKMPLKQFISAVENAPLKTECCFRNLFWEEAIRVSESLQIGIDIIKGIVSIAPLLGLLGTVTGIVNTFNAITEFGSGNASILSEGISIALITTQAGLLVALPGMFILTKLTSLIDTIEQLVVLKSEEIIQEALYA